MKMKHQLLFTFLFASAFSFGQVYQQGDLSVVPNFSGSHDSTVCGSNGNVVYMVTVNNSFINDSLLMKDANTNALLMVLVNNTGQSPWSVSVPSVNTSPFIPDFAITNGIAEFMAFPVKFKNTPDSVVTNFASYQVPVPNPCSYGSINGRVYIDNNNDCVYNAGDDVFQSNYNIGVNANYNGSFGNYFSYYPGPNGTYSMLVQTSYLNNGSISYSNSLPFAYPNTCSPLFYNFNTNSTFPLNNADFALHCTSNIDVATWLAASGVLRPAIPFMLYPQVSNMGCDTVSGWMKVLLDSRVSYNPLLSTNNPSNINGDTLIWNYSALSNLSAGGYWNSFSSMLHLTPDSTVNIGDTLCFSIFSNVPSNDINPVNNQNQVCYAVVNSFDPNAKEVEPKGIGVDGVIPPSQSELTYTIHFQNTGNAPAFNVKIIDTLSQHIVPESLIILGNSHHVIPQWVAPNVLGLNFNNINLPDSFSNEPASHGFITFKVKLKNNLALGTKINNTAYIYFDLNTPIVTNTVKNTINTTSSVKPWSVDNNFLIYPNPAQEKLYIDFEKKSATLPLVIDLFNTSGQKIMSKELYETHTQIDISHLSKGLYFFRIIQDGKIYNSKWSKE